MPLTDAPAIVTARLHKPESWTLRTYLDNGGYQGLRKALTMKPEDVQQDRGGAAGKGPEPGVVNVCQVVAVGLRHLRDVSLESCRRVQNE